MKRAMAIAFIEARKTKFVVEYLIGPQAWTPQLRAFQVPTAALAEKALMRQYSQAIVTKIYQSAATTAGEPNDH